MVMLPTEDALLHHASPDEVSATATAAGDVHHSNITAMQVMQAAARVDHSSYNAATAVVQLLMQTGNPGGKWVNVAPGVVPPYLAPLCIKPAAD